MHCTIRAYLYRKQCAQIVLHRSTVLEHYHITLHAPIIFLRYNFNSFNGAIFKLSKGNPHNWELSLIWHKNAQFLLKLYGYTNTIKKKDLVWRNGSNMEMHTVSCQHAPHNLSSSSRNPTKTDTKTWWSWLCSVNK